MRGASTAINAIGDGRKAAEQIIRDAGIDFSIEKPDSGQGLFSKGAVDQTFKTHPCKTACRTDPGTEENFPPCQRDTGQGHRGK